jgi:hypothetical protein
MFEVKPIPTPVSFNHPQISGNVLPNHEYTVGIIGKLLLMKSSKRIWKSFLFFNFRQQLYVIY